MQIHLFSSAGEQGVEYILEAARTILGSKTNSILAYLPAASPDDPWVNVTRAAFRGLAKVKLIDISRQPLARILATLDRADLLFIPGGNTYLLAQRLHNVRVPLIHREAGAADLMTEIRQRALSGLPLICASAGSILCGPDILTSNDANDCNCDNFDGLDLLPFNLNVHFPPEPGEARQAREERLQAFLSAHPQRKVLALEDGAYLRIASDAIRVMSGNIWEIAPGQPAVLIRPAAPSLPTMTPAAPEIGVAPDKQTASDKQTAPDIPASENESLGVGLSTAEEEMLAEGEKAMKTLLILRHAKSSWKDEALPDHDRPLNKRGKEDAPRMGKLLRDEDLVPDLIISSDAQRARTTTELVAEESHYEGEVIYLRDLYAAEPEAYLEALVNMGKEANCVMIVGHNPGLEELIQDLTDEFQPLPTAALAQVSLSIQHWSELDASALREPGPGKLVNLWRPKDL